MKQTKVMLPAEVHALLTQAKDLTGVGRLESALGALLIEWTRGEEPAAIAEDMLKGLPDFVLASTKPDKPETPAKKKRKPRPPGSTKRRKNPGPSSGK